MPKITVAKIPYLNSVPFYWNGGNPEADAFNWVSVHPRTLGTLARNGEIDAGPVSLTDSFDLENFEPLSDLGIAVDGPAGSVLLFSKGPLARLNGARVGLTGETSTSSELLKVILGEKHGVRASFETGFSAQDAARLLIGDEALKSRRDAGFLAGFPAVYDLGEEWKSWQGLPFVFARWMVKKDLSPAVKAGLVDFLEGNLESNRRNFKPSIAGHRAAAGWVEPEAEEYLKGFRYRLGRREEKAILLFREKVSTVRI